MRRTALLSLTIVAAVLFVYREAPGAYFFEDDLQWLADTLTYDPWSVFSFEGRRHFYRPVLELYFWAATPLFGGSATLFHIANVLLHAANGVLLFFIGRLLGGSDRFAFAAALLFVVMPGYADAVNWVGALGEPVGALFGCASILWLLTHRRTGRVMPLGLSIAAYVFALLTHESSVMFLPILVLVDWARDPDRTLVPRTRAAWMDGVRTYGVYAGLTAIYLVPEFRVNEQSYLVTEGHYRVGVHAFRNALDYIVSLYVGKKNATSYVMIGVALAWVLAVGTRRARLGVGWMLLALLPFVFFTWGNASRYLYLPAMGFALLLAEGVEWLDRFMGTRLGSRWRIATVGLVIAALAIRFSVFTSKAVTNFSAATAAYRAYAVALRKMHPDLAPGGVVYVDERDAERLQLKYLEGLIRWELRDPAVQVKLKQ